MKKKYLLIAVALVSVFACCLFAACSTKLSVQDVYSIASLKTDSGETSRGEVISIVMDGKTIYKYDNGSVSGDYSQYLDYGDFSIASGSNGLGFAAEVFENESLTTEKDLATYSADVKDVKALCGASNATDGKIVVTCMAKSKKLDKINLKYKVSKDGYDFDVEIALTMNY